MSQENRVHVHMTVSDLGRSRAFYTRFLGAEPVKEKPGYLKFLPDFGPLNLALSQGRPSERPGADPVDHMGIQVGSTGMVREILARVKESGLPVREEMAVNCCFANQDKFWVSDPDGVEWEVYHLNHDIEEPGKSATMPGDVSAAAGSGCCTPADREAPSSDVRTGCCS